MYFDRKFLATSSHPVAQTVRHAVRAIQNVSVPAPRLISVPLRDAYVATRELYYLGARVLVAEPILKAYCREYGSNVHTGTFVPYIKGRGDLILGDNVLLDGKISIAFAARYVERPVLRIGNHSGLAHLCSITVGKSVTIGEHCRIARGVTIFDAAGHHSDPELRRSGAAADADDVRPVSIEDNVWIGVNAIIHPGVTVGEGSIVAPGSVVVTNVPPFSIVAGNPARRIGALRRSGASEPAASPVHSVGPVDGDHQERKVR